MPLTSALFVTPDCHHAIQTIQKLVREIPSNIPRFVASFSSLRWKNLKCLQIGEALINTRGGARFRLSNLRSLIAISRADQYLGVYPHHATHKNSRPWLVILGFLYFVSFEVLPRLLGTSRGKSETSDFFTRLIATLRIEGIVYDYFFPEGMHCR